MSKQGEPTDHRLMRMPTPLNGAYCSVWIVGGWGLNPPNCFLNPPNRLSNYVLGGHLYSLLYSYNLHHSFGRASTVEKFNPPTNFSQFKHWPTVIHYCLLIGQFAENQNVSVQFSLVTSLCTRLYTQLVHIRTNVPWCRLLWCSTPLSMYMHIRHTIFSAVTVSIVVLVVKRNTA